MSLLRRFRRKPEAPAPEQPYGVEVVVVGSAREAQIIKEDWPLLREATFVLVDNFRAVEGLRVRRVYVTSLARRRASGHIGDVLHCTPVTAPEGKADPAFLYLGEA